MATQKHTGVLIDVDSTGVGVVKDDQSHDKFAFSLNKVKGYIGQSLGAAGLRTGARVHFIADEKIVKSVEVVRK